MRSTDHKPKVRLHCEERLAAGQSVGVTGQQAHYLARVMRIGEGEGVALFNATSGEWIARADVIKRDAVQLTVVDCVRLPRPEPGPTLAFAAIKKDGMDFVVVKATELGAARLLPMISDRSVIARVNQDRLRANAIEAAEQCGRLSVPVVDPARSFADLVAIWPTAIPLIAVSPRAGIPIYDAFHRFAEAGAASLPAPGFMVGPEGGFSPTEESRFGAAPFVCCVTMGKRILRADTAALAVLACWQAFVGDWRGEVPE